MGTYNCKVGDIFCVWLVGCSLDCVYLYFIKLIMLNISLSVTLSDFGVEKVKKYTSRIINYLISQDVEILLNHKLARPRCNNYFY